MNSNAPQARDERELDSILDDDTEVVTGVRDKVRSMSEELGYKERPDRTQSFENVRTKDLEQAIRTQLYVWERDIMMKTAITVDDDPERQAIIENILKEYEGRSNSKVYGFEELLENGKQTYLVYYDYTGKKK